MRTIALIGVALIIVACQSKYSGDVPLTINIDGANNQQVINTIESFYKRANAFNKKTDGDYSNRWYAVLYKKSDEIAIKSENFSALNQASGYVKMIYRASPSASGVKLLGIVHFVQNVGTTFEAEVNIDEAGRVDSESFFQATEMEMKYFKNSIEKYTAPK